jgi:hypothetical protein
VEKVKKSKLFQGFGRGSAGNGSILEGNGERWSAAEGIGGKQSAAKVGEKAATRTMARRRRGRDR